LQALRARLRDAIDPFDLDVFEPYLTKGRAALRQRTAVVLGLLLPSQAALASVAGSVPVTSGSQSNILPLAPTAPRFASLPIGGTDGYAARVQPRGVPWQCIMDVLRDWE
jgi:hypothetical protein